MTAPGPVEKTIRAAMWRNRPGAPFHMDERAEAIIVLRDAGWSLDKVGIVLDLSRERVRHIENRARAQASSHLTP